MSIGLSIGDNKRQLVEIAPETFDRGNEQATTTIVEDVVDCEQVDVRPAL